MSRYVANTTLPLWKRLTTQLFTQSTQATHYVALNTKQSQQLTPQNSQQYFTKTFIITHKQLQQRFQQSLKHHYSTIHQQEGSNGYKASLKLTQKRSFTSNVDPKQPGGTTPPPPPTTTTKAVHGKPNTPKEKSYHKLEETTTNPPKPSPTTPQATPTPPPQQLTTSNKLFNNIPHLPKPKPAKTMICAL
jgi:hypothetical protein